MMAWVRQHIETELGTFRSVMESISELFAIFSEVISEHLKSSSKSVRDLFKKFSEQFCARSGMGSATYCD